MPRKIPKIKLSFEIEVEEDCTPSFLANRIMVAACHNGALREGESIRCLESGEQIKAADYKEDLKKFLKAWANK